MPIELLHFDATVVDEQVELRWQTASEIDNDYFTIERSKDAQEWEVVTHVDGAGNSTQPLAYATVDNNPFTGVSYYRLKQTDFDGTFTYSSIRAVTIGASFALTVYPNPVTDKLILTGDVEELEQVVVCNALGQNVMGQIAYLSAGETKVVLDVTALKCGIYFVRTANNSQKVLKR